MPRTQAMLNSRTAYQGYKQHERYYARDILIGDKCHMKRKESKFTREFHSIGTDRNRNVVIQLVSNIHINHSRVVHARKEKLGKAAQLVSQLIICMYISYTYSECTGERKDLSPAPVKSRSWCVLQQFVSQMERQCGSYMFFGMRRRTRSWERRCDGLIQEIAAPSASNICFT